MAGKKSKKPDGQVPGKDRKYIVDYYRGNDLQGALNVMAERGYRPLLISEGLIKTPDGMFGMRIVYEKI